MHINLDMRELRYFVAVAEELHFGRAAERLHMTQPPLSQAIRRLEERLDVTLLLRTTRSVRLTDAGDAFLADARGLLDAEQRAVRTLRAVARGEAGELRVAAATPVIDGFLPDAIRAFRGEHPAVAVQLREAPTAAQITALREGRVHAGVGRVAGHDVAGLEVTPVGRERFVVAVPEGGALAAVRRPGLRALASAGLVMLRRDVQPAIHDDVLAAFARAGVSLSVLQTASTVHAVIALVAAGCGVAVVPESSSLAGRPGVAFRDAPRGLPRVEYALLTRRADPSRILQAFRRILRLGGRSARGT